MKAEVESLVRNAVKLDPTVTVESLELAIRVLNGERPEGESLPRTFTRAEIAKIFNRSKRTISNWAKAGRLATIKDLRGQTLCYTYESVMDVYHGRR